MFKTSKRLVAMLICLAMVLSMMPAVFAADGTTTVYYYNSNKWSTVKVHYWGGVQSSWPGENMTDLGNGYWSFEVPAGATGMLFNNGSGSQTGDLKVPTDSNNCYAGGAWVPYTGGTIEIVKEYFVRGSMNKWGTTDLMTKNADGTWSVTINLAAGSYEYKVADSTWTENWGVGGHNGANFKLTVTTAGDYIFTLDTATGSVTAEPAGAAECAHSNVNNLPAEDASCTTAGKTAGSVCADCGATIVAQEEIPALGHDIVDGTCTVCGLVIEMITVYYENNWMFQDLTAYWWGSSISNPEWPGVAPEQYSVTEAGYIVYAIEVPSDAAGLLFAGKDNDYGNDRKTPDIKFEAGKVYYMNWTEADGEHVLSYDLPVEPGCEHEYTYECDVVCNKCYEITREASHSIIAVEAKAATCYENGNIAYWYCEHCGSAWTDEACTQVTNMMSVVVPMAHADAIHVEAKAATCYENGNIEYWYCEACGQAWLDEACTLNTNLKAVILPAAHEAAIHVEAKAATCYENGNIEYWYCADCGQAWLDADCTLNTNLKAVILPMAHAEATHVAAKAPTCSENGNIEYWYCADCGQAWLDADCTLNTNLKAVVLPTADHEYFYPCDAHCMNCGELTNPDASHNVIHVEAVEATCTEMGNVEYWACSDCGGCWLNEALTMQTNRYSVITYADHDYQNNICSVCGDMDVEIMYQVSDDGTAIRLIAYVDDLAKYSSVSFIIYANGNEISCDVTKGYTSIRGGDVVYTTSDLFGADGSLALLTLNGVPADAELSVDVCYNGLDGETTYAYRYITLAAE